ncbi:MAG: GntR family transcriptional regulator [Herbinix sp.]|nr:GntR family transcriptional regulator [Herbinix sp.]
MIEIYIEINRNSSISYKKQLYDTFTLKILSGELQRGEKLPSSRFLAEKLNISRNTVMEIYDQLMAEAYVETVKGKGTYVSDITIRSLDTMIQDKILLQEDKVSVDLINFVAGTPDLNAFPKKAWLVASRKYMYDSSSELLGYDDSFGYEPLRKTLVEYLYKHKGIQCSYQQIMMTSGTKGALELISLFFHRDRKTVLLESPGISFAKDIFDVYGYERYPLIMDYIGINVDLLPNVNHGLIFTSSAHQFPLGGVLPIDRRQKLIEYANEHEHYIIEDDYDSEFRYNGAPVNSLYQLSDMKVIHVGTFSQTLAPALQLGYMVIPNQLLEDFQKLSSLIHQHPNKLVQMNIYHMFISGFYEKHIYKMCKVYKRKMKLLTVNIYNTFGNSIVIYGSNVGMHIVVRFPNLIFDEQAKKVLFDQGIGVKSTDEYNLKEEGASDAIVLGFGHLSEEQIIEGVKRLKKAILLLKNNQV